MYISVCVSLCDVYHVTLGQYVYACCYVYMKDIFLSVYMWRGSLYVCVLLCLIIIVYLYVQVSVSLECLFDTMFTCVQL